MKMRINKIPTGKSSNPKKIQKRIGGGSPYPLYSIVVRFEQADDLVPDLLRLLDCFLVL